MLRDTFVEGRQRAIPQQCTKPAVLVALFIRIIAGVSKEVDIGKCILQRKCYLF